MRASQFAAAWQAFGSNQTFNDYMKGIEAGLHSTAGQGATLAAIAAQHGGSYQALARAAGGMNAVNQGAALARLNSIMTAMGMKGVSISGGKDGSIVARSGDAMVASIAGNGAITIAGDGQTMRKAFENGYIPKSMTVSQLSNAEAHGGMLLVTPSPSMVAANVGGGSNYFASRVAYNANESTNIDESSRTDRTTNNKENANTDDAAAANPQTQREAISHYANQVASLIAEGASDDELRTAVHRYEQNLAELADQSVGTKQTASNSEQGSHRNEMFGGGKIPVPGVELGARSVGVDTSTEQVNASGHGMAHEIQANTDEFMRELQNLREKGVSGTQSTGLFETMFNSHFAEYQEGARDAQEHVDRAALKQTYDREHNVGSSGNGRSATLRKNSRRRGPSSSKRDQDKD